MIRNHIPVTIRSEIGEPEAHGKPLGWFLALGMVALLTAGIIVIRGCSAKVDQPPRWERHTRMMDTFIMVVAYGDSTTVNVAIDEAFDRMGAIERIASVFDSSAEAFRLNRDGRLDKPSAELVEILQAALNYYKLSAKGFDVTIEPVLQLWKGGLWRETAEVQRERLAEVRRVVGSDKLVVTPDSIVLKEKGMAITLGGIAKGYAVDQAVAVLQKAGITSILVNAGGDIATKGSKPDGTHWRLDLTNPDNPSDKAGGFKVAGKAVATSGNYERFFDPQKKAHHIIDPRTGFPSQGCISVTVIADDCLTADALATSLFVLGVDEGMRLVNSIKGVEAFIIDSDRKIHRSTGVAQYE